MWRIKTAMPSGRNLSRRRLGSWFQPRAPGWGMRTVIRWFAPPADLISGGNASLYEKAFHSKTWRKFRGGIYFDRTARRDRHHRHPGGNALASAGQGKTEGPGNQLHQQPPPAYAGMDFIRRRFRRQTPAQRWNRKYCPRDD